MKADANNRWPEGLQSCQETSLGALQESRVAKVSEAWELRPLQATTDRHLLEYVLSRKTFEASRCE